MEAINKTQVIGLFNVIYLEDLYSEQWSIVKISSPMTAHDVFGCDEDMPLILKGGTYLGIYSDELDVSDFPKVRDFVNNKLSDEYFDMIPCYGGCVVIFRLD